MDSLKQQTTLNVLMYLGGIFFLASIILFKVFYFAELSSIAQFSSLVTGLLLSTFIIYKSQDSSHTFPLYILGFSASSLFSWFLLRLIIQDFTSSDFDFFLFKEALVFAVLCVTYTIIGIGTAWVTPFILSLGHALLNFFTLFFLFFVNVFSNRNITDKTAIDTYFIQRPSLFIAIYLIAVSYLFFKRHKKDNLALYLKNPIALFMGLSLCLIFFGFFSSQVSFTKLIVNTILFIIILIGFVVSLLINTEKQQLLLSQKIALSGTTLLYFLFLLPIATPTTFLLLDILLLSSLLVLFSYTNRAAFIGTLIISVLYFIPRFIFYLDTSAQWVLPTALLSIALIIFSITYKLFKTKTT